MLVWSDISAIQGDLVSIVPLSMDYHDDLVEAANDAEACNAHYTDIPAHDKIGAEIMWQLRLHAVGSMLPFAIIDKTTGKAVGMTSFENIDSANRSAQIGATWYRRSAQNPSMMTEGRFLLLKYAFESLYCSSVEFRTHYKNAQSRQELERLGARLEGLLCSNTAPYSGSLRDTAVYSIWSSDWAAVKANLSRRLSAPAHQP